MRLQLHWQILIALVLAVFAGRLSGTDGELFGLAVYPAYVFIGVLFMNALKMIIVPLVMSSIITGICGIGGTTGLGRLGGKTLLFYMTTSLLAILTGLLIVNALNPGLVNGEPAREILGMNPDELVAVNDKIEGRSMSDLSDVFLSMVPANVIAAAAEGKMLGLIFFSLLFGYFITRVDKEKSELLTRFWQGVADVMMAMTGLIMKFAPLGVFGLVAKTIAGIGPDQMDELVVSLGTFTLSVLLALLVHVVVTLPLMLAFVGKVNPFYSPLVFFGKYCGPAVSSVHMEPKIMSSGESSKGFKVVVNSRGS